MNIIELISRRKSVRTFDGRTIPEETLKTLEEYASTLDNPFGIKTTIKFLSKEEHDLFSPVILGEHLYVAIKVKNIPNAIVAAGYEFEKLCLKALSLNLGSVILAGSLNRQAFSKAMEVKQDEVMPVASPLGYPAKVKSIREKMMRMAIHANSRLPLSEICFEGDFFTPLKEDHPLIEAFEAIRLAPSAANKQPWRMLVKDNVVHFYEKRNFGKPEQDIQQFDIGIALAHFLLSLEEEKKDYSFVINNPNIKTPGDEIYICSVIL